MKALTIAVALIVLAGCAQLHERFNRASAAEGASSLVDSGRPGWLRDPTRGEYPFSPQGW
ncbi:MAG TPA: hypothetical protein VIV54_13220 [Burkholderiales bacterium]